jgi:hypothetical protein
MNNEQNLINPNYTGSQEKILTLNKGYIIWKRILIISSICAPIFAVSISFTVGFDLPILLILVIPSGLIMLCIIFFIFFCAGCGFVTVNPNEAYVYQHYGKYLGTVKENGYFYGYPLATKHKVSLRSNQYNGDKLKVNDGEGNPVQLGIIVVWRIGDTAKAIFDVIKYEEFIQTQSEADIRYIGCKYPYEPSSPGQISLREGHEIINKQLKEELEKRVKISGIIIKDARLTEIEYGAEVAKLMLQKQASNATIYAKDSIVKGASSAVINSIKEFENNGIKFSDEEKAKYITGMMTTLCMSSEVSKIMAN